MVGGESDPDVVKSELLLEKSEELSELSIERQRHGCHFGTVGTNLVTNDVIRGQTDRQ